MAYRNVVVKNRAKLECSLNYLICRKEANTTKILLDEIRTIIIDTNEVSMTSSLISECLNKKIKIIFTDEKHNPIGEAVPYQNNFYSYRHIKEQISFSLDSKNVLWKKIIEKKILNQAFLLLSVNKNEQCLKLKEYASQVEPGDSSNREGHAAKVYFNSLFGHEFSRDNSSIIQNKYLNYGYSLLLSTINKEIKIFGYLTELGIHHIGESNQFNLSCDFMEPLRPLVDTLVVLNKVNEENFKSLFVQMLSMKVKYNKKNILLENAIHLYVEDLINFLRSGDIDKIQFIEYDVQ